MTGLIPDGETETTMLTENRKGMWNGLERPMSGPSALLRSLGSVTACNRRRRVILCGERKDRALAELVKSLGYAVIERWQHKVPFEACVEDVEAIILSATLRTLRDAFTVVHHANDWRWTQTEVPYPPDIIVVVTPTVPTSTIADFREQFCHVIFDARAQLWPELRVLAVERERLATKGAVLVWFQPPGSSPEVFLVGPDRRQEQMDLNPRALLMLRALGASTRALSQDELAVAVGCPRNQVKVYIDRLKTEFERCRKNVGILMSCENFIKNPGHGCGWRLHARVKHA